MYATLVNVEYVAGCVRKVIFGHYILQDIKKRSDSFWLLLWAMFKDRPLALRQLNLGSS